MHTDVRQEQHGIADIDGDGRPEIYGACLACTPTQSKGYYYGDWTNPTAPWKFQGVTPKDMYPFPFGGTGWLHGIGFGDVNLDGKPDLLERGGIWLQQAAPPQFPGGAATSSITSCTTTPASCGWINTPLWNGDPGGNQGGAHMYAYDIDGDGDIDIFSADWAHGENLAWYENATKDPKTPGPFINTVHEEQQRRRRWRCTASLLQRAACGSGRRYGRRRRPRYRHGQDALCASL